MVNNMHNSQELLFEEDYLLRTLGAVAHSPDVALTELVANAWDAGASFVKISLPSERGEKIMIEDDGTGLTTEQFHKRWMKLGYNRIKHQGHKVQFPPGVNGNRLAYGRNGIGRHGLLCFNDEYNVKTKCEGIKSDFIISTSSEMQPFIIKNESMQSTTERHGTILDVIAKRNLPDPDRILEVISARFLHDPQFTVMINGKSVPLEQHSGLIDSKDIIVDGINLKVHFIDSHKAARTTIYQGVAFWQGGRLVGEPSWVLGTEVIIDGRTRFAKRYTVVVKTNDLADYIDEDWTGFKKDELMDKIYKVVSEYVNEIFRNIAKDNIEETKTQIKQEFSQRVKELSPLGQYEVDEVIEVIALNHPAARPDAVSLAVEAVIGLEKTRSGKELLQKIINLSPEDVTGLNSLLEKWTVKDALCVLDEVDRRLSVIEAIRKLSSDKSVDELKILHPLVTEARWIFGAEFDSPEYVTNRQLKTAVKELFNVELGSYAFDNYRKRPDLVIVDKSTMSITSTEMMDRETEMSQINKILIIELKRGGFELKRKERDQAQGYVEDFIACKSIIGNPYIHAFVVGEKCADKLQPITTIQNSQKIEQGRVCITTFSQIVDTAERRLFGLREKLHEHYDGIPGMDLYKNTIQQKIFS